MELQTALVDTAESMAAFAQVSAPADAGAAVCFRGVVRNHDHGRAVLALEYEAHPQAGDVLSDIAATLAARHPEVGTIRLAHRIGRLELGECALFAEVFSAHRAEAFAACAELVDEVKHRLPVWKRQLFADGSHEWVNSP